MAIWQASRPTMMNSRIRGKAFWNEKFKFLILERVKDLIEDSDAVRSLPFILLFALPRSLQNFSHFISRLPFRVFTLGLHFFIFILFHLFFFTVLLCTWQFKIHLEQVKDWSSFFVGQGKETTALLIMKNFSRKKTLRSNYPRSIKMDFQVCNVGQGLWFRKKG